jgi:DegV family protein with EDD domain
VDLTAENTAIVLDSTCDFRGAQPPHRNWRIVPLHIHFGDEVYRDHVDLDPETFYRLLRQSPVHPHTSQPSPGDFAKCLEELGEYERVFVVTISSKLSGTYGSANIAANVHGSARVVVVDGGTVSAGTVLLADAIQRRLERGTSDLELEAAVVGPDRRPEFVFTVATLEYLIRGGRVSRAAGFAGSVMNTHPVLRITGGEIVAVKRALGRTRALAELERIFVGETPENAAVRVALVHANAADDAGRVAERVRALRPASVVDHVLTFGPVIGANAGPGAVALAWLVDEC